jgi:drug/metabolite transporter (DMT)-like permease
VIGNGKNGPPMAVFLALLCSLTYGAGDFFGGSAARKVHPFAVGWISHSLVVGPIAFAAILVGATSVAPHDLVWGAIGGLLGAVGLLALYAGLARGPMTIVAPTTALVAASLPVFVGAGIEGERPSAKQWAGIVLALIAILVISRPVGPVGPVLSDDDDMTGHAGFDPTTFGLAVVAGAGFGMFFVALHQTSGTAGLWPLVAGRAASSVLFSLFVFAVPPIRRRVLTGNLRPSLGLIAAAASLDLVANVFYLLANRRGALSVVAVLSSLYPASTILLANRLLNERIDRVQAAGIGLAAVAVGLVALG